MVKMWSMRKLQALPTVKERVYAHCSQTLTSQIFQEQVRMNNLRLAKRILKELSLNLNLRKSNSRLQ